MNYLAHAFLSFDNSAIIVGNVTGDAVKGSGFMNYIKGIREGLLLHRYIDSYTDQHQDIKEMTSLFKQDFGRYSGIIVDVICDHILAKEFQKFSKETLDSFIKKVYSSFNAYKEHLPYPWIERSEYMIQYNWLQGYSQLEGVERSLQGLSRRNKLPVDLSGGIKNYLKHKKEFEDLFSSFFKQLDKELPTIYEDVTFKIAQLV